MTFSLICEWFIFFTDTIFLAVFSAQMLQYLTQIWKDNKGMLAREQYEDFRVKLEVEREEQWRVNSRKTFDTQNYDILYVLHRYMMNTPHPNSYWVVFTKWQASYGWQMQFQMQGITTLLEYFWCCGVTGAWR